jgi:ElaB/YqjD/DUF883 family membrane-anchored ribosome-binding protein
METPTSTHTPSASEGSTTRDGVLTRAATGAHGAVDKIAGAADAAIRGAKPALDRIASIAHEAVDKTNATAAPTAEWLTARGEVLKARSKLLIDDSCRFVATKPLTSIAIALAIGVLVGRIIRSSSGSRT